MRKCLAALAAVVLIAGCVKMDKTPPKDLPDYVKYYPGSEQMMTMSMGAASAVVIKTTASPDDVLTFYRAQAAANGLSEQTNAQPTSPTAQKQVTFADATTTKLLQVAVQTQQGETLVTLGYKPAPKASS